MADHVGEEFDAMVSSVTKFGMFVELDNTVEGLIHISEIGDDYYVFVEKHMALVGRNKHKTYRIGQPVRVKLLDVKLNFPNCRLVVREIAITAVMAKMIASVAENALDLTRKKITRKATSRIIKAVETITITSVANRKV